MLPDGLLASGSQDQTVCVWDTDSGAQATLVGHTDWVITVALLPDGKLVSESCDGHVKVWR
jgi:WD40 repeat protein